MREEKGRNGVGEEKGGGETGWGWEDGDDGCQDGEEERTNVEGGG